MDFANVERTNLKTGFIKALKGEALFIGDRDVSLTFFHEQNYGPDIKCNLHRAFIGLEYHRVFAIKRFSKYKEIINYK